MAVLGWSECVFVCGDEGRLKVEFVCALEEEKLKAKYNTLGFE